MSSKGVYRKEREGMREEKEIREALKRLKDEMISRLKHELEEVTRERNRIMREYNEKMAKVKVGTLTLDQVEHRLIPKK